MEIPKFTIVYNKKSDDGFVGVCWEFYTDDNKAQARYDELSSEPEKYSVTKRPYYHDTDKHHLGAGHWELKNSPKIFDKNDSNENGKETPIAKLRNKLSPYYSLPSMILSMEEKPEIKSLLIEQAKVAKETDNRIKELLSEIESYVSDYEESNNDKKRLVREIDVILCGKDAAIQASLCDLVSPIKELKQKHDKLVNNEKAYLETIKVNNTMLTEIYSHFGWQFDLSAQANTEALLKANKTILE